MGPATSKQLGKDAEVFGDGPDIGFRCPNPTDCVERESKSRDSLKRPGHFMKKCRGLRVILKDPGLILLKCQGMPQVRWRNPSQFKVDSAVHGYWVLWAHDEPKFMSAIGSPRHRMKLEALWAKAHPRVHTSGLSGFQHESR